MAHAFIVTIANIAHHRAIQTKAVTNQQLKLSDESPICQKTEDIINMSSQRIMAPHSILLIVHIM